MNNFIWLHFKIFATVSPTFLLFIKILSIFCYIAKNHYIWNKPHKIQPL